MKKRSKILITGANGFIGRHLVKRLGKEYDIVTIAHKKLFDHIFLSQLLKETTPEYIIHTAAYGNMSFQQDIDEIIKANIIGTYNLLNAANDIEYKGFINFGTSSEYGKKDEPMTEEMLPEADTFYAASKVSTTYLSRSFAKHFKKPIVTVRPFSVYGEFEAEFRFIPRIIASLHSGEKMDIDIDGVHDWIYIEDFLDGIELVMENSKLLSGQVVNIGTGKQYSNQQVIEYMEQLSGRKLIKNLISGTRPNDSHMWVNGSTKLASLGWKPKYSLREGLKRVYAFYTYA